MEKYKFKLTVSRVFLIVCFLIILLLSYMLVIEHDKVKTLEKNDTSVEETFKESDALKIANDSYRSAYNYVNNSLFINNESLEYGCMQVNVDNLNNYFTDKVVNDFKNSLETNELIYYDCGTLYNTLDLASIFGVTDQGIRELTIVSYKENIIIANGKLNNEYEKDRYIVFVKENDKWLIDMYE